MRDEISAAVVFLVRLIERNEKCNRAQLDEFKTHLSDLLRERFENHWFPEQPCKGQGYRCIRVNECSRRDATLERAALACGLKYEDLKLPVELTIWVDPKEVCCRFGEHKGSYCTLASFPGHDSDVKVVVENCPPEVKLETSCEVKAIPEAAGHVSVTSTPVSSDPSVFSPSSSLSPNTPPPSVSSSSAFTPVSKEVKPKVLTSSPNPSLTSNNQRPSASSNLTSPIPSSFNNRSRGQNSPKQGSKTGGRKNWLGPSFQHPLQPWYNMLPPHPWMAASPPPYMLRSPPRSSHPSHHRYHWAPHKPTLKV